MIIKFLLFPVVFFVIVFLNRKDGLKRNAFRFVLSGQPSCRLDSKSCTRCGKQVPLSSAAGGTCPHCGVYWSSDHTVHK